MMKSRRHPALHVALHLWSGYQRTLLRYWIIFTIAFVGINLILRDIGAIDEEFNIYGIWSGASSPPKIFFLIIGIFITPLSLASYISNGITRKHFTSGALLVALGMSLLSTILLNAGYPIERIVVDLFGGFDTLKHPPLVRNAVEHFFLFLGYFCCGWTIGSGFYRFNWRIGMLICLLALVPPMLMEATVSSAGYMQWFSYSIKTPFIAFGLEVVLLLLLSAFSIAVNYWMLRRIAIKRKWI